MDCEEKLLKFQGMGWKWELERMWQSAKQTISKRLSVEGRGNNRMDPNLKSHVPVLLRLNWGVTLRQKRKIVKRLFISRTLPLPVHIPVWPQDRGAFIRLAFALPQSWQALCRGRANGRERHFLSWGDCDVSPARTRT